MNLNRFDEFRSDYKDALKKLEEALAEDISKSDVIVDGTIQRFEFSFELAWKLAKTVLDMNGMSANSPRMVIKESYKIGLIKDGDAWLDMLMDRNKTSHIYDESESLKIYDKIKNNHAKLLIQLLEDVDSNVKTIR